MMTETLILAESETGKAEHQHPCEECALEFTRHTLARHLANNHRLDLCRRCSKPVLTFQVTPLGATLDFCSGACVAEVRRLRLCFKCLSAYTPHIEAYFCSECTEGGRNKVSQFSGVVKTERAIRRAQWLPVVYQRFDPNAWKLRFVRLEDVA